jgi:tRNA (guanine37-N1)-methyltransferase
MQKKAICIKVPKRQGEKALAALKKLKIIDSQLEIQRNTKSLFIPLLSQPSEKTLKNLRKQAVDFNISTHLFQKRKKPQLSLINALQNKLPPHLLASLPHSMDFIGDIAIIEIPSELKPYRNSIGKAVLKTKPNLRTVVAKASAVSGTYRLRKFSVIAGEHKTETVHREHGCQYYLDISKAYFSPRLSYEHKRVSSAVHEHEAVVDLFAGVGPFAIQIAKTHENVKVYAIDMNPHAVEYLKRNVRLNRAMGKVHPILGNARQIVKERLRGVAHRVIMNLPEKALDFVDVACQALKPKGGTVHFYSFITESCSLNDLKASFSEAVQTCGREGADIRFSRIVRETAPHESQVVLDVEIK